MINELQKRILTSTVLIFLISISIYLGPLAILFVLLTVSGVAYLEFSKLMDKIYEYSHIKHLFRHSLILFYCFAIFFISTVILTVHFYDFIFVLCICIFSDVGGYIVGKTFRGPKLTKISPNKTISGSIGSILFSFIPLIILNFYLPENFLFSKSNLLFCIEITIVCQLGDLFISYFKRKAQVKDTGKILPGHGGLLDRIDGMIFALPYGSYKLFGFEIMPLHDFFKSLV